MVRLDWRKKRPNLPLLVEVDDASFYSAPVSGTSPTSRRYLGDLVRNACHGGASVVALDFQLKSPSASPGDDPARSGDNQYLLDAIREAKTSGTPVVLACGFVREGKKEWKLEPNIFPDTALPAGAGIGYINLPIDRREILLEEKAWDWDGKAMRLFQSYAIATVSAYETAAGLHPKTLEEESIKRGIRGGGFVYGGFLDDSRFTKVSALRLWKKEKNALDLCKGKIVLIGGTWHQWGAYRGPLIESFDSPAGKVPGIYLHANYVEDLLVGRYAPGVPLFVDVVFDLVFGFAFEKV